MRRGSGRDELERRDTQTFVKWAGPGGADAPPVDLEEFLHGPQGTHRPGKPESKKGGKQFVD